MEHTNTTLTFSVNEKIKSLEQIRDKLQTSLYVYEKSQTNKNYNYKDYIRQIILYVASSNNLFDFGLTDIIIELNSIIISDLNKKSYRKIILDNKRKVEDLIQDLR